MFVMLEMIPFKGHLVPLSIAFYSGGDNVCIPEALQEHNKK